MEKCEKCMKCLIIVIKFIRSAVYNPDEHYTTNYAYPFPIGLAYISAVLKKAGCNVTVLNLNHCEGTSEEILKNIFSKESYDLIITGAISPFFPDVRTIVRHIRRYAPNSRVVIGGGMVSSQPEVIFRLIEPDFAVIGEGEFTLLDLIACIEKNEEIKSVDGIMFRDANGQLLTTKPRAAIEDLDSLPFPDFDGFGFVDVLDHLETGANELFDSPRTYPIVSSRSCPFRCTFCFHPLGNKYRKRTVENVLEEIRYAVEKYRINSFELYDELFSHDKNRVYIFCQGLKEIEKTISWKLKWSCQMRVDTLDDEMTKVMRDAGCVLFSLGLESFNEAVLKSMRKHITPQQIDQALRFCVKNRIAIQGNFIFGDIAETNETYQETLSYWEKNCGITWSGVALGFIQIYPGTEIYHHALKKGIIRNEAEFLEERANMSYSHHMAINFTKAMSNKQYDLMKLDILFASLCPRRYVQPIAEEYHEGSKGDVRYKCPYCGKIDAYKNFRISPGFTRVNVTCHTCGGRFVLVSKKEKIFCRILTCVFKIFGRKPFYYPLYYLRRHPQFNAIFNPVFKLLHNSTKPTT